ncbi:hypothetical protein LCGC14_1035140 [marine sediment metagenome]|uniref:DnaB/C C-terminal domain-containing protein n=1 Tax=marine sediment metagenome TaxID=412755 RepID=A0A0F9MTE7_9ZZZZ
MAEARLLRKKISKSERVNALPIPARLLFTWMIPHLDVEGRMSGNPKIIQQTVLPLASFTPNMVDKWLNMMQDQKDDITGKGLIERYEVGNNKYLWMPGFIGEQSPRGGQTWKTWEPASDIPAPPDGPEETPTPAKKPKVVKATDDIIDPVFGKMCEDYENNIGMLSPMLSDRVKIIQDEYPEGWFTLAIGEAVTYNKRNLKYIEAILARWKTEGINPLEEIPAKEKTEEGRIQEYTDD